MSMDMIGNGNLPCVYSESIIVDENENKIEVNYIIPDYFNSRGHITWGSPDFLINDIYFVSVMVGDIDFSLENIQDLLHKIIIEQARSDEELFLSQNHILLRQFSNFKEFDKEKYIDVTINHKNYFDHIFDIKASDNINLLSFIVYFQNNNTNPFFVGPCSVDSIKKDRKYALSSTVLERDSQIYKGSFHEMEEGVIMSGVVHDDNASFLSKRIVHNYKLSIIRNFTEYETIEMPQEKQFKIKKPLWSFGKTRESRIQGVYVFCIFSCDLEDFLPPHIRFLINSRAYEYNYNILANKIQADLTIDGVSITNTLFGGLRPIKINHQNSDERFFEIVGYIPTNKTTGSVRLNVTINHSFSATHSNQINFALLDFMFGGYFNHTHNDFFLNKNSDVYSKFAENYLKLLSSKYKLNSEELLYEKAIIETTLSGNIEEKTKIKLINNLRIEYEEFKKTFKGNALNTNYSISHDSLVKNFQKFRQGKAPIYIEHGYKGYVTVGELDQDLKSQANKLKTNNPAEIIPGVQNVIPKYILGKDLQESEINSNTVSNILDPEALLQENLNFYNTSEDPSIEAQENFDIILQTSTTEEVQTSPTTLLVEEEESISAGIFGLEEMTNTGLSLATTAYQYRPKKN